MFLLPFQESSGEGFHGHYHIGVYTNTFFGFFSVVISNFYQPIAKILPETPVLESRGDRPLKMTFEDQLKALIFFHLEDHVSARHLIQVLNEDDFARENIAPQDGIGKSSFSEAINNRGLEQLAFIFQKLGCEASNILPNQYTDLGELVAIDGSLIDAVLSMTWADYRKNSKKAKIHLGFNLNQGIPSKIFFTNGKGAERPFVRQLRIQIQNELRNSGSSTDLFFFKEQKRYWIKIATCRIDNDFTTSSLFNGERRGKTSRLATYSFVQLASFPSVFR